MLIFTFFLLTTLYQVESIQFLGLGVKNSETYGPYKVDWKYFGVCPHNENWLGKIATSISYDETTSVYRGVVNVSLPEAVRIDELKIVIETLKNDRKKVLLDYTAENPCQQRIVVAFLKKQMDVRSCVMKKGNYHYDINFTDAVQLFFGPAFFYGDYLATFTLGSKKQRLGCVVSHEIISKKV